MLAHIQSRRIPILNFTLLILSLIVVIFTSAATDVSWYQISGVSDVDENHINYELTRRKTAICNPGSRNCLRSTAHLVDLGGEIEKVFRFQLLIILTTFRSLLQQELYLLLVLCLV